MKQKSAKIIIALIAIILPAIVILYEYVGNNFSEILSILWARVLLLLGDRKAAKTALLNLINKYPDTYNY